MALSCPLPFLMVFAAPDHDAEPIRHLHQILHLERDQLGTPEGPGKAECDECSIPLGRANNHARLRRRRHLFGFGQAWLRRGKQNPRYLADEMLLLNGLWGWTSEAPTLPLTPTICAQRPVAFGNAYKRPFVFALSDCVNGLAGLGMG
jgi:hypothetical protein